jgi:hypothetical protein
MSINEFKSSIYSIREFQNQCIPDLTEKMNRILWMIFLNIAESTTQHWSKYFNSAIEYFNIKLQEIIPSIHTNQITDSINDVDLRRRKPPNIPAFQLIEFIELLFYHHKSVCSMDPKFDCVNYHSLMR